MIQNKIMRVKKSFRNLLPTDILISTTTSKIMSVAINNQSKNLSSCKSSTSQILYFSGNMCDEF